MLQCKGSKCYPYPRPPNSGAALLSRGLLRRGVGDINCVIRGFWWFRWKTRRLKFFMVRHISSSEVDGVGRWLRRIVEGVFDSLVGNGSSLVIYDIEAISSILRRLAGSSSSASSSGRFFGFKAWIVID